MYQYTFSSSPLSSHISTSSSQSKRILGSLPVASNSLSAGQILVLYVRLLAFPLVCIADSVLHALGSFSSGFADAAGDVADGGFEGFVEHLAQGIADDGEEALWLWCE